MQSSLGMFTDLYQLTMAKAYWTSGKSTQESCFELFFRTCPFDGEYLVVAGFENLKAYLENFSFSENDIEYLKSLPAFQSDSDEFLKYLKSIDLSDVTVTGLPEGSLAFPREPILQVTGPLLKVQILESALLNAINFSSLVATYARRLREASGDYKQLVEFGMRRAQGPNGALTASRSSIVGGFNSTSNVQAGAKYEVPVVGTMAHSFIQSFQSLSEVVWREENWKEKFSDLRKDFPQTNEGELAAFVSYAQTYPAGCLLLVDTYNSLQSGIPNAILVFKVLKELGYKPLGIRLDSGDLVYLSKEARRMLDSAGFQEAIIFASNELSEEIIYSLKEQGAKIDGYGVGTKLSTCFEQPALGGVYKLVQIENSPRLKLSEQTEKSVLPGKKKVNRLYNADGKMLLDLLQLDSEPTPAIGKPISALHPFDVLKKANVSAAKIENLLQPIFQNNSWVMPLNIKDAQNRCSQQMQLLREDIKRRNNPTPYKVSVTKKLRDLFFTLAKGLRAR